MTLQVTWVKMKGGVRRLWRGRPLANDHLQAGMSLKHQIQARNLRRPSLPPALMEQSRKQLTTERAEEHKVASCMSDRNDVFRYAGDK